MKKVLIISPNWPPIAYPDMQRVRMASAHFRGLGWEPLILAVTPELQGGVRDPLLAETLPDNLMIRYAGAIPAWITKWIGISNVGIRSIFHFATTGSHIIRQMKPDIIFFSTTMFVLFILGPYWLKRHSVPYILDFQDPWVNDPETDSGGWTLKRRLVNYIARFLEPMTIRHAAAIVCVSPDYPVMLARRYPDVKMDRYTVLPFGATTKDMQVLLSANVKQNIYDPKDGCCHWVYTGVINPDMELALRAFCMALKRALIETPGQFEKLRVHFIGTNYADHQHVMSVQNLAHECGVGDIIMESPERIAYFEALQCLNQADALIATGASHAGYTASKIYPYILFRKPLLGIFHQNSSVVQVFEETQCGTLVKFGNNESVQSISEKIFKTWFHGVCAQAPQTDWNNFRKYTSEVMSEKLCSVFEKSLQDNSKNIH